MNILLLFNLATILLRPTFTSCGISPEEAVLGSTVKYSIEGSGKWMTETDFKGSLLGLKENTSYVVQIFRDGEKTDEGSFKTWKSDVPVAKTIEIDPAEFKGAFKVNMKGSEDGWIRITAKGGKPLVNPSADVAFIVDGASYVLLDDMTLIGGPDARHVITIYNSDHVRVRGCDISGWGSINVKQNFTCNLPPNQYKGTCNGRYGRPDRPTINYEAAIEIGSGSSCTVIERCYVHDPLTTSVSWYYCHPAGPEAIYMRKPEHSTVLRWNDFVGSDVHRWNDAVEGAGNFHEDGGFNRDADIYGNFMIFANDDCIELDGGQQNVRTFENRFEGALCGASIQGCMVSPTFVYNNLFSGMVEEFNKTGQTIKTSRNGKHARAYIFDNILWGRGSGYSARPDLYSYISNNKFYGESQKLTIKTDEEREKTFSTGNEFGLEMDEKDLPVTYPTRPLDFTLSRARITVGKDRTPVKVKIIGNLPKGSRIVKPEPMDWLLPEIKGNNVIIRFDDTKMHNRREYRGAFLVRTPEGLSRPVSVYATSDFIPALKAEQPGDIAVYAKDFTLSPKGSAEASISVPKDGRYWILVHGTASEKAKQRVVLTLDGETMSPSPLQQYDYPTWAMVCPGCRTISVMTYHFDLKAGVHSIALKHASGSFPLDALVLTDNPKSFEPR